MNDSDASDDDKPYLVGYAESKDGRTFTKPPLHQYPLPGSGSTNSIIGPGLSLPEHEGCSVWVDEKRALGGKYVSQGKMTGKGCAKGAKNCSAGLLGFSVSTDGTSWEHVGGWGAGIGGCDTQSK